MVEKSSFSDFLLNFKAAFRLAASRMFFS